MRINTPQAPCQRTFNAAQCIAYNTHPILQHSLHYNLPPQPIEHITPLNLPLPAAPRQRTRTIHQPVRLHTQHTHPRHSTHKRRIPRALANRKAAERNPRNRVLRNALVRGQCERGFPALGLGVEFVVPGADCGVEGCARFGRVDAALFGRGVCTDQGGEVDRGKAFGCWGWG
jgi:hypothetical protein